MAALPVTGDNSRVQRKYKITLITTEFGTNNKQINTKTNLKIVAE